MSGNFRRELCCLLQFFGAIYHNKVDIFYSTTLDARAEIMDFFRWSFGELKATQVPSEIFIANVKVDHSRILIYFIFLSSIF